MRKKPVVKSKKPPQPSPIAVIHANVQMPEALHDAMKTIRHIRYQMEGSDVKLCRIYREAVEQYVNAKPQQELVNNWRNGTA